MVSTCVVNRNSKGMSLCAQPCYIFTEKCFQGVHCSESRTMVMLSGSRIKCPQCRNSERYCNAVSNCLGLGLTESLLARYP